MESTHNIQKTNQLILSIINTFIFPLFCLYVLYFDHLVMRLGSTLFIGLNIVRVIQLMFFMGYAMEVSTFVKELLNEVNQISNSVIHIASGVVATNNSIANQITKTSDIENEITHTQELAVTMQHASQKNISVIEEGAARIETLASAANKVMDYSQDSTQTMVELKDKAGKILEIIQFN